MIRKRTDFVFTMKVLLGAAAAMLVLASWLIHPAMSGEMTEPGRYMVCLFMIGVSLVALVALIFGAHPRSTTGK